MDEDLPLTPYTANGDRSVRRKMECSRVLLD